jgi:hypothetical protein
MGRRNHTLTRVLTAAMLTAALAASTIGAAHAQTRAHIVTLTFTEHRVIKPILLHGQAECFEMKQGSYYDGNGVLQTGKFCEEYGYLATGHALVNGVEADSLLTDYSYIYGKDKCEGGTTSGHYGFGTGTDGFDVVGI